MYSGIEYLRHQLNIQAGQRIRTRRQQVQTTANIKSSFLPAHFISMAECIQTDTSTPQKADTIEFVLNRAFHTYVEVQFSEK